MIDECFSESLDRYTSCAPISNISSYFKELMYPIINTDARNKRNDQSTCLLCLDRCSQITEIEVTITTAYTRRFHKVISIVLRNFYHFCQPILARSWRVAVIQNESCRGENSWAEVSGDFAIRISEADHIVA
jgi:hypothetical protein